MITPTFAAQLLARNDANRPVRPQHVDALARDMEAGRYQLNGEAIKVALDGTLLDGQHRLMACVKSGRPFETLLVTGLSHSVMQTIDSGVQRLHSDRLAIRGIKNANIVSAAIRVLTAFALKTASIPKQTTQEMDVIFAAHPGIEHSSTGGMRSFPGMGGKLTAAHYVISAIHGHDEADAYVAVWRSGVPAYDGCPAHLLRERLWKTRESTSTVRAHDLINLLSVSINKFVASEKVRVIKPAVDCGINGWTEELLYGRQPTGERSGRA
jgi:hypothetical protein